MRRLVLFLQEELGATYESYKTYWMRRLVLFLQEELGATYESYKTYLSYNSAQSLVGLRRSSTRMSRAVVED
jgi:hypothetical protein